MITEKDKKLIDWAWSLSCFEWNLIDEDAAETEEGRNMLHTISSMKYHQEEAKCGCL